MITPLNIFKTSTDVVPYLDDDSRLIYPLAENILFITQKIIDLYLDDYCVYGRDEATIVGLYIKQSSLYSDYIESYKLNKFHLCFLFQRIIYESYIKMCYLIKYGKEAQRIYRLSSYKTRYDFYKKYKDKEGYFKVRNDKFLLDLKDDGFNIEDCNKKIQKFGGKNLRQLITEFDKNEYYSSLYGIPSDTIHSDWAEIRQLYLSKINNEDYIPVINTCKHFRILMPMCSILLDASKSFLEWKKDYSYKTILIEHERVIRLISECIVNEYNNYPCKYMKE